MYKLWSSHAHTLCIYLYTIYLYNTSITHALDVRLGDKDLLENAFVIPITLSNVVCAVTVEIWIYYIMRYNL